MTAWLSQLNIRTIFDLEKAPDSPALRKRLLTALGGSTLAPGETAPALAVSSGGKEHRGSGKIPRPERDTTVPVSGHQAVAVLRPVKARGEKP